MELPANMPLAVEPFLRKMVNRNQQDIISLWRRDGAEVWFISPAFEHVFGYPCSQLYDNPTIWLNAILPEDTQAYLIFSATPEQNANSIAPITYRIQRIDKSVCWIEERRWFLQNEYGEVVGVGSLARDVTNMLAIQTQLQAELLQMQLHQTQISEWINQQGQLIKQHLQLQSDEVTISQTWPSEVRSQIAGLHHQLQQALAVLEDTRRYFTRDHVHSAATSSIFNLFALLESVQDVLAPTLGQQGVRFLLNVNEEVQGNFYGQPELLKQLLRHQIMELLSPHSVRVLLVIVECIESTANAVLLRFTLRSTIESTSRMRDPETGIQIYQELVARLCDEMGIRVHRSAHHFGEELMFEAEYVRATSSQSSQKEQLSSGVVHPSAIPIKPVAHALVIEDNSINQHLVSIILKEIGCSADFVSDGLQALALADREYDFILVDIGLPGMDGFEVAHQLKKQFKEKKVPIIGMSAHMSVGADDRELLGPLDDFIYKPFGIANVSALLEKWVIKYEARSQVG